MLHIEKGLVSTWKGIVGTEILDFGGPFLHDSPNKCAHLFTVFERVPDVEGDHEVESATESEEEMEEEEAVNNPCISSTVEASTSWGESLIKLQYFAIVIINGAV